MDAPLPHFVETFLDNGYMDMRRVMQALYDVGYNGVLIPDHIPHFGADPRVYLTTGEKFVGDEEGHVKELHIYDVEWAKNDHGAFIPKRVPGTDRVVEADLVLLAMGFLGPEETVLEQLSVEQDARSNAKAEHGRFSTNISGIFAAGDCRRGQSLVVWAINEGRGAARECDRFLMGETNLP